MITYEYPFNERIRTYLRLESLFLRLVELMSRDNALDHHYALASLFEVMDVGARADLKSDVLRDLEKQKQILLAFRGNPGIAQGVLDEVLLKIEGCYNTLNAVAGKAGHALTENDWLMGIRSRIGIPGGTCAFDLPAYFAWQHESPDKRRVDLQGWVSTLNPLVDAISLLLTLLRDSGVPQKVIAPGGQFQQTLPQGRTFQLLRMQIDPASGLIPEISGNRLIVSVRLLRMGSDQRLHPIQEDAAFDLNLCS